MWFEQSLEPIVRDQVVAFVAHTACPLDVKPGLDGHDIAGDECFGAFGHEVRGLGMTESDSVAGVRREIAVEAEGGEVAAYGGVNIARCHAGAQLGLGRAQRPNARVKEFALAGIRPRAHRERIGKVATITRDNHREVDEEQVAALDHAPGR